MARDYEKELADLKQRREEAYHEYLQARRRFSKVKAAAKKEERRLAREKKKAATAAARRERFNAKVRQRRAAGLCIKCGQNARPSKRKGNNWSKFCRKHHAAALRVQRISRGVKRPYIPEEDL